MLIWFFLAPFVSKQVFNKAIFCNGVGLKGITMYLMMGDIGANLKLCHLTCANKQKQNKTRMYVILCGYHTWDVDACQIKLSV